MFLRRLLGAGAVALLVSASTAAAQTPARGATPPRGRGAPAPPASAEMTITLAQLMRSILLPNSNLIFAAQKEGFANVRPDDDPSLATDPFKGVYGGWQAVENAGLALIEASRLITMPGRRCSNGRLVPLKDPDFVKLVDDLRTAGMSAYKAAQAKDQGGILDAADQVSVACSTCHLAYREKVAEGQGGEEKRCLK